MAYGLIIKRLTNIYKPFGVYITKMIAAQRKVYQNAKHRFQISCRKWTDICVIDLIIFYELIFRETQKHGSSYTEGTSIMPIDIEKLINVHEFIFNSLI